MAVQSIPVSINLENEVISGNLTFLAEVRLSDFLNSRVKFLTLTGVSIIKADGTRKDTEEVHVNKESIKMIQTTQGDAAQGIGCKTTEKMYPYIQKKSVRATIHMADFEVDGKLHCNDRGVIPQLLEQENAFLPCTYVTIRDMHSSNEWQTDFAAINRKQVAFLETIRED